MSNTKIQKLMNKVTLMPISCLDRFQIAKTDIKIGNKNFGIRGSIGDVDHDDDQQ